MHRSIFASMSLAIEKIKKRWDPYSSASNTFAAAQGTVRSIQEVALHHFCWPCTIDKLPLREAKPQCRTSQNFQHTKTGLPQGGKEEIELCRLASRLAWNIRNHHGLSRQLTRQPKSFSEASTAWSPSTLGQRFRYNKCVLVRLGLTRRRDGVVAFSACPVVTKDRWHISKQVHRFRWRSSNCSNILEQATGVQQATTLKSLVKSSIL